MKKQKRGFTLLEILLVIALIGILASIVLVAINPNNQLAQARNTVRFNDITEINQALENYFVANRAYPAGITTSYQDICPVGVTTNCVNLSALVPTYMPAIPTDPTGGNYKVATNPDTGQISLNVSTAEIGATIAINPISINVVNTFVLQTGGSSGANRVKAIDVFPDGSIIVGGGFEGSYTLEEGGANQTVLISAGLQDIFISKYNPNGTLAWAKRAGSDSNDYGVNGVATFNDGSAVVTGSFSGNATFGEGSNSITLISPDIRRIFVAKYSSNGTLLWAKNTGGVGDYNYGMEVISNNDGSSLVTGYFQGTSKFGEGEANETIITSSGPSDNFIAKYNSNGTLAWVKTVGSVGADYGYGISRYEDGSFVTTGVFRYSMTFGAGEPNVTTLSTQSGFPSDVYIAKYNADGTLIWARRAGGSDEDWGRRITSYSDGSSIVTGFFGAAGITFGQGELSQTILTSSGSSDMFIAKYNSNGTLAWAKKAGSLNFDQGIGIASNIDGSILVTGKFAGNITFAEGESNQTIINTNGGEDGFIAKYNSGGSLVWVRQIGGIGQDSADGVAINSDASIMVTGFFSGTGIFGLGGSNLITLNSKGLTDIFIAKYKADGSL